MGKILAANITVMVTDLDAAIEFYRDKLGFSLTQRFSDHWADIQGFGLNIGLHPSDADVIRGSNLQIGLRVDDIDAAVKSFEGKGLTFKVRNDGPTRQASFTDPDGNALYLIQPAW